MNRNDRHDELEQGRRLFEMGKTILLNDGWQFAKGPLDLAAPVGLEFRPVDLPHDWLIYDTNNLYENSIGWYRRYLDYNLGQQVFLYFEGVYMDCSLHVNQEWIGDWKYGYSSFEYEITQALVPGQNEIMVKVVHQSPNSRWYSGAGIYRNVWLKLRDAAYIVTDGIYISTKRVKENPDAWMVEVESEVVIGSEGPYELSHTLLDGETVLSQVNTFIDNGQELIKTELHFGVEGVERWSPASPKLYQLRTTLKGAQNGECIETCLHNLGFKDIIFDPDLGLLVNGQKTKLNGVCEHHDLGALGAAFSVQALQRRMELLKEMGVNAIRTAHNMPAPALMDLADQMGFLIVSEAFDMWIRPKTRFDYARFFSEWVDRDVASWVRRDRNHPSLLMWSIGNEVFDTHLDGGGLGITQMLIERVRRHDPKGNAKVTFGSNYLPWEDTQVCAERLDVVGYNYGPGFYENHHTKYPHWVIYGSETSAVVQSRGIYHFPLEKSILADDDGQCSALGNSPVSWGAKSIEACLAVERQTPFSLGQFIWTGFDYIGEPTPYHSKNSYFGQVDTATFPKDSYYIYQAAWTDYRQKPMVHLFPYWDFNPGQSIDVQVCSNAPLVSLELNGEEIGRQDLRNPNHLYVTNWKLPFVQGELRALAYNEKGEVIATMVRHSFGDAERICLKASQTEINANGTDLLFVEISMEDSQGYPVENANNRVHVEVSGAGRLIGLDNGDSTDFDSYKGTSRRLFSGKLMAIIASTLEGGEIYVLVSSPGLASQRAVYRTLPSASALVQGVSAQLKNEEYPCITGQEGEVPLRKIELIAEGERVFTPTRSKIGVQVKLHPANTSYRDLEWRVVSDGGIDSKLATFEVNEDGVCLTAQGDGHFRLRCASKNGTNSIRLLSELEFEAIGLGKLFKNPYAFIAGGLYDFSVGEVGNGNERGVATARGEETQIGFRDLDFGPSGSDTITIPFFALSSDPYPVQIWEGKPREKGSTLLADVVYQRESKWNVYQSDTYKLNKRLRGITSLWIVTHNKMHIKGFSFSQQNRAFYPTFATDYEQIYGDSYSIEGQRVEGIGNNVTIDFGELDFGQEGVNKIVLSGRTSLDKTIIQVRFINQEGESRYPVEFLQSMEYTEQSFTLQPIKGKAIVRFIFLPGSQFDFSWFQFYKN